MYIHYSTGNNSGPRTLVHIVEVSVIGGVHFGGSTVYLDLLQPNLVLVSIGLVLTRK